MAVLKRNRNSSNVQFLDTARNEEEAKLISAIKKAVTSITTTPAIITLSPAEA